MTNNYETAKETIKKHLTRKNVNTDSYQLIDSKEWDGEYGKGSILILIHEEAESSAHTNMDGAYNYNGGDYTSMEELMESLDKNGFYIEQCTLWYSAIYLASDNAPTTSGA